MSREERIIEILTKNLSPAHLKVVNESHQHSVPANSETHFNVLIVSHAFKAVQRIQRQRMVFDLLRAELTSGLHALTLKTLAPEEWTADTSAQESPLCHSKTK